MASVTLQKARRILLKDGPLSLARRGFGQIFGVSRAYMAIKFGNASRHVVKPSEILEYGQRIGGGVISPFQVQSEILALLQRVADLKPKTVLEIGTANGGTLFLFTRVADFRAHLISVDLPGGSFGEGYAKWRMPLYRAFAMPRQTIDLVRADSHSPQTLDHVRSLLGGKSVDFLFIDGDHSYEGVTRDYEMYRTLVRPGGLIGFHDVAHHEDGACQVEQLWNRLRTNPGAEDLTENPEQGWAGIGVLRV